MNAEWLPRVAFALAVGALAASALALARRGERASAATRWLASGAALFAAGSFLFLLSRFVVKDLGIESVFLYTRTDLPLRWRIAGSYASREGSLLLWTAWLSIVCAVVAWSQRRPAADEAEEGGRAWTRFFLLAFLVAFLAAVVAQRTFAPTPEFFLQGRPEGNGLNPTLKSPFILIHPPLTFLAYALAAVPAAAALGHLASGTDRWSRVATRWSRLDWLLYTFAMGLGGLWAYYTLGFGGYWAWDPVEVANLLPWIALTLYLHAQLHHARHGDYRTVGPFLALLPMLLTLFSTISTRSGLWVSVHAFTDPTSTFDPDAPGRFLAILDVEPSLRFYVAMFLATLGLGLGLWSLRLAREHHALPRLATAVAVVLFAFAALAALDADLALRLLFQAAWGVTGGRTGFGLLAIAFAACLAAALPSFFAPDDGSARPARGLRLDLRLLAYYSVLVLGVSLLVLFLLHAAAANGWSTGFYEARLPVLATPALLGLLVLQGHGIYGRQRSLVVAAIVLVLALAVAFAFHRAAGASFGGTYLVSIASSLAAVSLDRVRRTGQANGMKRRDVTAGTFLLLGAFLDVVFWVNPPSRIGLGAVTWHPVWPAQLLFGGAAFWALFGAHRILAGCAPRYAWHVHALVAALGGFYVAPLLALAAWLVRRPVVAPLDAKAWARLRLVGLYGVHLAVALALAGYAASTYYKEEGTATLEVGASADVAAVRLHLAGVDIDEEAGTPFVAAYRPVVDVERGSRSLGAMHGVLAWEPQVGSHFPLPVTLRAWDRDVYLNVRSVTLGDQGACGEPGRTIPAYQPANPPRACSADGVRSFELQVVQLPGLSLVWAALFLFLFYMMLMMKERGAVAPAAASEPRNAQASLPEPNRKPALNSK